MSFYLLSLKNSVFKTEHAAAVKVRDYIRSLFLKSIAKICIRDWDKYGGRVLGELFLETGENVAEILIHRGWARPYRCEKKSHGHWKN
jgi:endonuclease YncB( thermonuclease family)